MAVRPTPNKGIRYPTASSVVDPADIQTMAQDMDTALTADDSLRTLALHRPACHITNSVGAISIAKGVTFTFTFDTIKFDTTGGAVNLSGSPGNQRITPNTAGLWLFIGYHQLNATSGITASEVTISKNGLTSAGNIRRYKVYGPWVTSSGTLLPHMVSGAFVMNGTTDYVNLMTFWAGSPAGPLNTFNAPRLQAILIST
jgi:hypothetical protein